MGQIDSFTLDRKASKSILIYQLSMVKAEIILIALHALYALSGQKTFGIETQHGKINWEALWAID